jgi:hypothetical protein
MFALAATIGVSMACSPAFADPLTHHPIVRGWTCSDEAAIVRWEAINGIHYLQVALDDDGYQEGGFYFDVNGIPVQKLSFTAYYSGSDDYDFYWYAGDQNGDSDSGNFNYFQVPGHPGFYLTVANIPPDFPSHAIFSYLGVEVNGDDVSASVLSTHWAVGSLGASIDFHVQTGDCGSD